MMNKLKPALAAFIPIAIGMLTLLYSCKEKPKDARLERFTSNKAKMVVDESFQPIVDEELYVFKAFNKKALPQIDYEPENTAVNLLLSDSTRSIVLSRELTPQETQVLSSRNLRPVVYRFAIDAVALIVNQASNDTTITVAEIKKMLNGDTKNDKNIVFDNPNSGLVRYLKELSGSKDLKQKNIYALKSNKEVIKYVSEHPNAIGITGFAWLNDPDKDYADAVDKVKLVGVMDEDSKTTAKKYYTPSQATLALKQYPLKRNLYILNCAGNYSLGTEFATFMKSDRGQRIILKSGLLPDEIPGREINVQHKITQ